MEEHRFSYDITVNYIPRGKGITEHYLIVTGQIVSLVKLQASGREAFAIRSVLRAVPFARGG